MARFDARARMKCNRASEQRSRQSRRDQLLRGPDWVIWRTRDGISKQKNDCSTDQPHQECATDNELSFNPRFQRMPAGSIAALASSPQAMAASRHIRLSVRWWQATSNAATMAHMAFHPIRAIPLAGVCEPAIIQPYPNWTSNRQFVHFFAIKTWP